MSDPVVTLRLDADSKRLLAGVRESIESLRLLGNTSERSGRQAETGARGLRRLGDASEETTRSTSAMASALNSAKAAIAAYAGMQAVSGLIRMADQYANISSQLKLATNGQQAFAAAQVEVFAISQRTSTELDSTASLFARLAQSTAEYGVSQQRQLALTETINRTFAVSGASAVAASNTITQFTQALAGGTLRAEEFNSVIENSPRLAKALADGMGVGMGELRKQVNDGQVTVEKMIGALESQAGVIEAEFNQLPLTVERAMVQLRNAVMQTAGQMSEGMGFGSELAGGIASIAKNLDLLAKAVVVVAVAYAGKMASAIAQDIASRTWAIAQARTQALVELQAARAAEAHAVARLSMARAGMTAAGGLAAAEANLAAAQVRTAAATTASSFALTAKASAMRAATTAMAAFGGPVGLAITALMLFVLWAKNSKAETDRLAESVSSGFQDAIDKLQGFNKETANKEFAGLASANESLEKTRVLVSELTKEYADLNQSREYWLTKGGALPAGLQEGLDAAAQKLEVNRVKFDQLSEAQRSAIDVSRDLVLEKAGIVDATEEQRKSLEALLVRQASEGQTLQQNVPHLKRWAAEQADVAAVNRLAQATFDDVGVSAAKSAAAIKAAAAEISQGLNQQINQLQLKLIEQTQGKAAAMRAGFIKSLADKGIDPTSAEAQALRALNEQMIASTEYSDRLAEATRNTGKAEKDAGRVAEERQRALDQQADSQRRYTDEAALAAAELGGPLKVAEEQRKQRIAELDAELAKHNITQAAYNTLTEAARETERKRQAEVAAERRAPQALLDTMSGEIQMLGLIGPARERYQRQLRNEEDMRRAINEANKAGAGINAEMTASLIDQARAYADLSIAVEEQAANLQEWADVGTRGIADVADLFSDMLSGNLDDSKSFFDQLKDVFKRGWRDILRTAMEQNFVRPFQEMLTNAINGAFSGASSGGGWMSKLSGMFGGGASTGGASTAGSGWFSKLAGLIGGGNNLTGTSAMAANSGWMSAAGYGQGALSGISGSWMNAGSGAGSLMGFGNNMGNFAGSGAGAAGAGMMGSMASIIPIIGWIYAGMQLNNSMYAKGWKLNGSDYSWGGAAASPFPDVAVGGAATDKLLQKLGLDAKTSSMITGTATLTALFGRKAPKVQAQGLMGTYGFEDFAGQNYADIKAKGGLFRSDKKWTEYSALDSDLQDTFNVAIRRTRTGVTALAEQLGMDITSQLSSVRVDIGKVKLDADPEKAKAQMEELLSNMIETLAGKGVGMVGFEYLLKRGFDASDVMYALSASIQLMTGSAHDLGRALNTAELDLVGRTVTMFQKLANAAGTTLEEEISSITSAASSYGNVVGTAQQEIATAGFSGFAKGLLAIRQEERERIRTLNDQAKALHGLTAREQDLATVRQAAQLKTDALVAGLQSELVDLALNRINDQIEQLGGSAEGAGNKIQDFINSLRMSDTLSPDTDATRRVTANDLMSAAALAGDADAFTQYAQQFLEVSRALNASAAGYQADYDRVLDLAKQFGGDGNAASLEQLYAQREALQAQQEAAARLERAQRIAQGVSDLSGVNGRDPLEILRSVTGMTPDQLAGDLGLSVGELGQYLAAQKTDIGDLADILYDLPKRIAAEMITVLVDREVPVTGSPTPGNAGSGSNASSGSKTTVGDNRVADSLDRLNTTLARQQVLDEMALLRQER